MLIPFALIILLLIGALLSFVRPDKALFPFGKEQTLPLRAILAIGIILHHTGYCLFNNWGGVIVAIFFLLSGYGLISSYNRKGDMYLNGFFRRRVIPILIPFIIAIIVWQVYLRIMGDNDYCIRKLSDLLRGDTSIILPTSWFVFAILLVYLDFYFIAKIFKHPKTVAVAFASSIVFAILFFVYLRLKFQFISSWFISSIGLIEGALFAGYEKSIRPFFASHRVGFCSLSLLCVAVVYGLSQVTQYYHLALNAIAPLAVIELVLILGTGNSVVLNYIGKISLEIYLVQGIVLRVIGGQWNSPTDIVLFAFLAILLSIIAAALLFFFKKKLLSWFANSDLMN